MAISKRDIPVKQLEVPVSAPGLNLRPRNARIPQSPRSESAIGPNRRLWKPCCSNGALHMQTKVAAGNCHLRQTRNSSVTPCTSVQTNKKCGGKRHAHGPTHVTRGHGPGAFGAVSWFAAETAPCPLLKSALASAKPHNNRGRL